jgi:two-component system sensor kinase FixL
MPYAHNAAFISRLQLNCLDGSKALSAARNMRPTWSRKLREQASDAAPERKPDSLRETISEAIQLCSNKGKRDIDHEVDRAADAVLIDRIQIEQVLPNLLRNACEASDASRSAERILASAAPVEGGIALIRVSEGGSGVPETIRNEIFKTSFTTKPQGMGLGLSIYHTIVEKHGGRIWVEENHRGGADFCFTVPLQRATFNGEAG